MRSIQLANQVVVLLLKHYDDIFNSGLNKEVRKRKQSKNLPKTPV